MEIRYASDCGCCMCGGGVEAHAAIARRDEAGNLDDARARGLLFALAAVTLVVFVLGGVGLSLHNALSESPACSRGLR